MKRIKQALGLDETLIYIYGAAPLKQTSVDYFASLDIPLFNMYGLSETSGSATVHKAFEFSLTSCGMAVAGANLKIANPDENGEGEICIAGRTVMMGYLKNEEATTEVIDEEGYFKTGDLGKVVDGKWLKITGRIKELIITAGGENVAPVIIEDLFKLHFPACSNIMLVGENERFIAALVTLKCDLNMATGEPLNTLLPETVKYFKDNCGVDVKTSDEAISNQKVLEHLQKCVNETNKKVVSKAAHIKKFKLLAKDFSIPGGELTPTMKLKRKITIKKYADLIAELYATQPKL